MRSVCVEFVVLSETNECVCVCVGVRTYRALLFAFPLSTRANEALKLANRICVCVCVSVCVCVNVVYDYKLTACSISSAYTLLYLNLNASN